MSDDAHTNDTSNGLPVVGIGASAGGIEALKTFFSALPPSPGAIFVVVVHLAPEHRSELASILGQRTPMPVAEVTGTMPVEKDHVYVISPDRRLQLTDDEISAVPFDQPRAQRAPVDLFFRSLAGRRGQGFAVILSGGGSDGAVGAKVVKGQGGFVLVQDPQEAAVDGMPRATIATGMADVVLPVAALARRLAELIKGQDSAMRLLAPPEASETDEAAALDQILAQLDRRTGHDFSQYKRTTVLRRVARRMQLHRLRSLHAYLGFLKENPEEAQPLFKELLISVTTFFRDAEAWEALRGRVIPELFADKERDAPLRVWVPGCATGEEAYSLAMLLVEAAEERSVRRDLQIFATDMDESALAVGREGRYPEAISADVSEARLQRFFVREDDHYRVGPELRDRVLFASHSLLRDPPFSRMDLISCRNLLIYLDRDLQEKVFGILRYALLPGGYLFLGVSETADGELFRALDGRQHLYQARDVAGGELSLLPDLLSVRSRPRQPGEPQRIAELHVPNAPAAHRALLEQLAPPSILVDERRNAVHLSETAGRYLQPPGGPLARDLAVLVRPELQAELSAGLYSALEQGESRLSGFVPVQFNGKPRSVAVLVQPRRAEQGEERLALVLFLEGGEVEIEQDSASEHPASATLVQQLKEDLRKTRMRLRTAQEEFEATNEELRAANEELQSVNEEYRSAGEELETSKEELQSTNEELQTVNAELQNKLQEVSRANSDLENLVASTEIPTLFLDRQLRIRRFTPQVAELFRIRSTDLNRPISELVRSLDYGTLEADAQRTLSDLTSMERQVRSEDGRWHLVRLRPYRTEDDHLDGAVISFVDITAQKQAEELTQQALHYFESIVDAVRQPLVVLNPALRVDTANRAFYESFKVDADTTRNRLIYELGNGQWDIPELRRLLDEVLPDDDTLEDFRVSHDFEGIGRRIMLLNARRLNALQRILLAIEDITVQEQAAQRLRDADRQKDEFLAQLGHELRNPLAAISNTVDALLMTELPPAGLRDAIERIARQVGKLLRLVDDLLNISRVKRGQIDVRLAPMDLRDSIRDAVEQARPTIGENGLRLDVDLPDQPLPVLGDAERLTQIVSNLLCNAAQYTDAGKSISLAAERAGDRMLVRVRDTGIGMSPEQIAQVFAPFSRSPTAKDRHPGGMGLGLALARQFADLHGGKLTAHSEGLGCGSELVLELPRNAEIAAHEHRTAPLRTPTDLPARRVLLVEDDASVGAALRMLLEQLGQTVRHVTTGSEALAAVPEFEPDLVLLDLYLPDISGQEVARRLRQEQGPRNFRLVALSGYPPAAEGRPEAEVFDQYLVKPAPVAALKSLLEDAKR